MPLLCHPFSPQRLPQISQKEVSASLSAVVLGLELRSSHLGNPRGCEESWDLRLQSWEAAPPMPSPNLLPPCPGRPQMQGLVRHEELPGGLRRGLGARPLWGIWLLNLPDDQAHRIPSGPWAEQTMTESPASHPSLVALTSFSCSGDRHGSHLLGLQSKLQTLA